MCVHRIKVKCYYIMNMVCANFMCPDRIHEGAVQENYEARLFTFNENEG